MTPTVRVAAACLAVLLPVACGKSTRTATTPSAPEASATSRAATGPTLEDVSRLTSEHEPAVARPTLVAFASLPPDTFAAGPRSGQFIDTSNGPINGRTPPFDRQPVQGFSDLTFAGGLSDGLLALSDNGFGTKANSADYLLSVYRVRPAFRTATGGAGTVDVAVAFRLRDPDKHIRWPIVADGRTYPNSDIAVPRDVRRQRLLTGADFDVESIVRVDDGYWIGDEFGPFLLHVDKTGRLIEPPVELPGEGLHSPDHPTKHPGTAKISRSAGFGALMELPPLSAPWEERYVLLPILEKPLAGEWWVRVFAYDRSDRGYLDRDMKPGAMAASYGYPLGPGAIAVGGASGNYKALLLEHDDAEGDAAGVKRVTFTSPWSGGKVDGADVRMWARNVVVDLLDVDDPHDLNRDGSTTFRFPFRTIGSVAMFGGYGVLVVNDNNYPFGSGRGRGEPDPTEVAVIRLDREWDEYAAPRRRRTITTTTTTATTTAPTAPMTMPRTRGDDEPR